MIRFGKMLCMALPLIMCGCFEVSHQIVVNKDGSGRIVERFAMSKAALKQLNDIFSSLPSAKGSKSNKTEIYDKDKLKADAKQYGPDVTYVSSKKVSTTDKEGYEVEYAFRDITALRVNQNPGNKGPAASDAKSDAQEENITFQFEKGTPAALTVMFPQKFKAPKDNKAKAGTKDKAVDQKEADELRDMFKDLYIGISIRPEGTIVDTNATYIDNGTITLLEMDFKKLITNEEQFQSFIKKEPKTIEETKALLKNLPGFKVELNEKLSIKFE